MAIAVAPARGTARALAARGSGLTRAIERRTGLTSTGIYVLLLAGALFVVARLLGNQALFMLTYGAFVVIGLAYVLARRKLSVETRRSQLPTRVRQGQIITVQLGLKARRKVNTVVLEEVLDEHLGATVRLPVAVLPAGEEVTHEYSFTPRLRGVYTVGPLVASWSDPFGLTRKTEILSPAAELIVHPRTESAQDRVLSREWEDPPVRPPITKPWPSGYEFYGLRDYVSGDDPRRIVWRATARTLDLDTGQGRYLVRESEQGITDRVSILLDSGKADHSPGDPSETFETAVRVAASLATRHLKDGFTVTTHVNSQQLLRPMRSQRDGIRLLDELARLQPEPERLTGAVERILRNTRRDTHIAVIAPHLDQAATGRIKLLIDRGVSVVLVLVVWEQTDPISLHRAGQLGCNIVEVNASSSLEAVFRTVISQAGRR